MSRAKDAAAGVIVGAVGGAVAAFAMNRFQAAWSGLTAKVQAAEDEADDKPDDGSGEGSTSSVVEAAHRVSKAVVGKPVAKEKEQAAGNLVHYATGAALGAIYGAAVVTAPRLRTGAGALYGLAVWLFLDEGLTPALGLTAPAGDAKLQDYLYPAASHVVFGVTLDAAHGWLCGQLFDDGER